MIIFAQEVESLHPCVRVTNGAAGISNYDIASYVVYLDKKPIFKASRLSAAVMGMFCLYFIFGVEYPRSLRKTYVFLSGHVVGIPEPQLPTVQSFFNKLSCWAMHVCYGINFFYFTRNILFWRRPIACRLRIKFVMPQRSSYIVACIFLVMN